eukprot:g2262.t1
MGVPPNAPGSRIFGDRARGVLKYVEIQNFILMAAHLGVVNKVYWVFNPWCLNYRFGDGPIEVTIGVRDGMLWLTAPPDAEERLDYFREQQRGRLLPWSERDTLTDTKRLMFQTMPTAQAAEQLKAGINANEEVLLDIDEDYFATESIFAQRIRKQIGISRTDLEKLWALQMFPDEYRSVYDGAEPEFDNNIETQRASGPDAPEDLVARHFPTVNRILPQFLIEGKVLDRFNTILKPYAAAIRAKERDEVGASADENLRHAMLLPMHYSHDEEVPRIARDLKHIIEAAVSTAQVKVVSLCRSPTYTPDEIMATVECTALACLRKMFTDLVDWHMEDEDKSRIVCGESSSSHRLAHVARPDPTTVRLRGVEARAEPGSNAFIYLTTAAALVLVGLLVVYFGLLRGSTSTGAGKKKRKLPGKTIKGCKGKK